MVSEITVGAEAENAQKVLEFVGDELKRMEAPKAAYFTVITAVEEIFLNIVNYAYGDGMGDATVHMETDDRNSIVLTFIDSGQEFDPLARREPDTTVPLNKRAIGGLGILMVKKTMDDMTYTRVDGENRLSITKRWE